MKNSIKFGITTVSIALAISILGVNLGSRIGSVNERVDTALSGVNSQVSEINSQIDNVVSFLSTTTTSTTSTTTTTTTTVAPKPSKSAYIRKLDEYFPGASSQYPVSVLDAGGKMACMMWNAEAGVSRIAVIREIQTAMGVQNMELAAHISQAVLWTLCPSTATFPFGPRETAEWG